MSVVDGFAYDEHGGQGEMVVMHDFSEVFKFPSVDVLVRPCEMVASSNGCVFGIFLKEFALHIIHNSSREENAHGALASGEEVQLFLLWHGGATFTTSEDDGLGAFGNGELAAQFGGSGEERRDARGDMVGHAVLVEERHLLLDGTEDTGVARVETNNKVPLIVVLLHQGTLLLKVHVCAASHHRSPFVTFRQCFGYQRPCIEDQVCLFQHHSSADTHQVGIAWTGANNLDMTMTEVLVVDGNSEGIILVCAFLFGNQEGAVVGSEKGCGFTDTGGAHMLSDSIAGRGYFHLVQLVSSEEEDFLSIGL